jgi:hypothetical protein
MYVIEDFRRGRNGNFLPKTLKMGQTSDPETLVIHSFCSLSYDRSVVSSKASSPHSAI